MLDLSGLNISGYVFVGLAAIVGLYFGFGARRIQLPAIIGYMALGVLLGPSALHLLPGSSMEALRFITEIALGFVAFTIGSELSLASLKRLGSGMIAIILCESFAAFFVVLAAVYLLTRDLPLALLFGAMAPASAPAGTVAVIQECKSKGSLTKALYAVVGFDDGLAIIIFGFAAGLAHSLLVREATGTAGSILAALGRPAYEIPLSLLVGGAIGLLFCQLVTRLQNASDVLIITFGCVLLATGLSLRWHLSLILTNMMAGFVLVNTRREATVHRAVAPVMEIMPLLFVLFFCLAGAQLHLSALPELGMLGIVYILGRSFGLIAGARIGGSFGHVEPKVKKYIGMGILSQAGVAIGLALIVKQDFDALAQEYSLEHAANIGAAVLTTVTATSIVFEVIGPILTKVALVKAGETPAGPHTGQRA